MASAESREFDGQISSGDVDCSYMVTLYNSGRWFVTADFHDNGGILGDAFVLEFPVAGGRGIRLDHGTSALGAGDTLRMNDDGLDPFIREHWPAIRDTPLTAKLFVSPDIMTLVVGIFVGILAIGSVIAAGKFVSSDGKTVVGPCANQLPGDHGQCLQFRHVSEGDPGSSTITG
ncbi:hypothetical protein [Pseudofrankia inefficax]|uniref:Uncharacterized protein n=1 Tax=Pseudofrankia inefficax (strain DSM 45817 / CECT 9037 / DDB 130130 / EuI1c) TaxID=298654 RepID=E3IW05_PSEI1|nr:hypothetical protein [Pseudofrankia inefficax]ADP84933.1 hypothetical protein FraEuI1c_6966 [Pseudofrankia inefficax]